MMQVILHKLPIKRMRDVPLPAYQTAGASGLDLYAAIDEPMFIPKGQSRLIPTGIAIEIPQGYEGQIRPRSGLAKKGVWAKFGTIDSDYRGEIKVDLFNGHCGDDVYSLDTEEDFITLHGFWVIPSMRIAQLVITPVVRVELVEVDELSQTERGENGFGHTGV